MKKTITLFFGFWVFSAMAQSSIDLLTIGAFYSPPANYNEPWQGTAQESGTWVNLKVPIKLNDKIIWYNEFTHMYFDVKSSIETNLTDTFLTSMRLAAAILQTGVMYQLSKKNALQLLLVPRLNSDLLNADNKRWQMGAMALFETKVHSNLTMRYGLMYSGELLGPLFVPLVYVDWQMSSRWRMTGTLPISLRVAYHASERLSAGFHHFGLTTTYRIGQEEFRTDYVERNSIDESIYVRWRLGGNLHIEGRVGYSLGRNYTQYAEDEQMAARIIIFKIGDNREPKNVTFANGPIAAVRLVYNLPLD